ncbi:DUF4239 domain-containing protein [Actinophytocola oryzae]|uniref:Uncharacterized protein DUF4239 n=1 Tax=Actinophytocola oryzae TaxID=502181 RepID=A0A4R7VQW8_9PSEU|nr:DUF4239 domain-containing protein [Actinophytocola oryzae]TDV52160.1 uncharacterized protein DUF4239 [Actinophytocola oryzae]
MNLYVTGLLWVVGVAVAAGFLAHVVRRWGSVENNDAAGQVFTLVGGLQAVMLAFVLISLFDATSTAESDSYREADSLVAAVWAADALPTSAAVATQAKTYAHEVVNQEWPKMAQGLPVDDQGWNTLEKLRAEVVSSPAADEWSSRQKAEAADQLWQVYQARQDRLNAASSDGVNSVVWFALVAGAVMAVALPILFGGPKPATHIFIVSILAATMTLLLFATQQLHNPYGGGAQVDAGAFEAALARLT